MCDVQGRLVAWLDGELSAEEAAEVQRHVEECKECRSRAAVYEQVSEEFDVYCDAVVVARTRRGVPRWAPVLAGAVVAAGVMVLAFPRIRIESRPVLTPTIAVASVSVPTPTPIPVLAPPALKPAPRKVVHRRHEVAPVQEQAAKWHPMDSAVQIAIPAEAMFPPGAMPKGMNFIAELSIAPDGSVKQVRLRQ